MFLLGSNDIILLKYDSTGVRQWTRQIGTTGADQGIGLAVSSDGNFIYVTGYVYGSQNFNGKSCLGGKSFLLHLDILLGLILLLMQVVVI